MKNTKKSISNYAIELSSFFLIAGYIAIQLIAKTTFEWFLILQLLYLFCYLNIAKHVLELLKKFRVFAILFTFGNLTILSTPLGLYNSMMEKLVISVSSIFLMVIFYLYCTPTNLESIGWAIEDK